MPTMIGKTIASVTASIIFLLAPVKCGVPSPPIGTVLVLSVERNAGKLQV